MVDQEQLADRYRVEARIGQGGMAEVYRGFDPSLDRQVAIKVLVHPFDRDAGFVARFRREAQAAARLNHPNIVGVYDAGSDGDTQFIVMEYIEGRTLASFLAEEGVAPSPMQAVELTEKVAAALESAHQHGIVHRDIKPANVMVTRGGEVKVMDFGIARLQTDATAPQTSSVIGTPAYFSPEQAQGQPVDARSDIYSLGCVLYELIAHRQPFTGDTPVAVAYKQVNEVPPAPSAFNPDVPPALDAVVMKCMAKNPANRYQTAAELIRDLERVRNGLDVEATPLLPMASSAAATQVIARQPTQVMPPPEPEGSSRKLWLGALIALLVLAVLAGGGYLLAQALKPEAPARVTMPFVKNKALDDATAQLEGLGLAVRTKEEPTLQFDPDTVIEQDPSAGTLIDAGSEVILTVAVRPDKVEVPDLHCKTVDEAVALLPEGMSRGATTVGTTVDPACAPNTIVEQTPEAGTMVFPGSQTSSVDLVLNPALVSVGQYTCTTYKAAKAALEDLGLRAAPGDRVAPLAQCPEPSNVAQQDTAPGTQVPVGSTVTLHLGSPQPSPSTSESASPSP
jgi:beta-lactam-binding protein with PASTA domain/predicted Ser/Thr protein kinase